MQTPVPEVRLNNGVAMPVVGFGVFQVPNDHVIPAVRIAIESGYRSIDTAALYGNEAGVGQAVAASGVAREELFVTSKLWNDHQGYDSTFAAFEASVKRLNLDYLDLYLIHWPEPAKDRYVQTWRAFEKLAADERVRAIGVSNFQIPHLQRLLDETHVVPAVNQIELHPEFPQHSLRQFHDLHQIVTEAWSPLGQGRAMRHPAVGRLADRHDRTPAQIVLRWQLQLGNVVIPKSVTPARIKQNIAVFDFQLTESDMAELGELDTGTRYGPDPDRRDKTRPAGFFNVGGQWVDTSEQ